MLGICSTASLKLGDHWMLFKHGSDWLMYVNYFRQFSNKKGTNRTCPIRQLHVQFSDLKVPWIPFRKYTFLTEGATEHETGGATDEKNYSVFRA